MKPLTGKQYLLYIVCDFQFYVSSINEIINDFPSGVLIGIFTLQVFVTPQGCLSILKTNVLYKPL